MRLWQRIRGRIGRMKALVRRVVCAVRGHDGRRYGSQHFSPKTISYNRLPLGPNEYLVRMVCERCGAFYSDVAVRHEEESDG